MKESFKETQKKVVILFWDQQGGKPNMFWIGGEKITPVGEMEAEQVRAEDQLI